NGTSGFPGPGFGGTGQGFPANIGDATWNDAKFNTIASNTPGGGGDFVSVESADTVVGQSVNTAYSWGSTARMVSDVQSWLDATSPNFGWLLENDSEALQTTFRAFYTKEGAIEQGLPQFAPDLVVGYVVRAPEPPTVGIIGLAALTIGLLSLRRRISTLWAAP